MKKKGIIALFLVLMVGVFYYNSKPTYKLYLPQSSDVEEIVIQVNNNETTITDQETIKAFILKLRDLPSTRTASFNDTMPQDSTKNYIVSLVVSDNETYPPLFFYELNGTSYLEQPYNGVYKIDFNTYSEYLD